MLISNSKSSNHEKIIINICIVTGLLVTGCTKNFDTLNTDPTKSDSTTFNPNLLLPSGQLGYLSATTGYSGPLLFQSMWIQTFASSLYPGYYSNGDKYVQGGSYLSYQASTWNNAYQGASYLREIQNLTKGKTNFDNLRGIAVICEVLNIAAVTDVYGDAPYSQALQAKTITQPVYDKQQDIYNSMLSKLDSVITTLDAAKPAPTNDAFPYKGNVAKWKKFGYSLMLKLAMRLTKVDIATAKKYAEKAYAGGVFASNADNAYVVYDNANGFSNGNSSALVVAEDYSEVKWGKGLIDLLKATADPRLGVIAEIPPTGTYVEGGKTKDSSANPSFSGNSTPAAQLGMPNGYDQNGGATDISKAPGYPGRTTSSNPTDKYSRPKTTLYIPLNTAALVLTYAQTEFLLAEAAVRGWAVGASASAHYTNAISAGLQTYATLNAVGAITATVADAYATSHPLDISTTENSLKNINTQYWVYEGTVLDFDEAWSNWRRSAYPVLTPVTYPGNFTSGTIPRRQSYPATEATTNPNGYKAAVAALTGGDTYAARVWWDK